MKVIQTLIDKQDSFEIVRDQIAGILLAEFKNQQNLAQLVGKDPHAYELDVFTERASPWEKFLEPDCDDTTPIVNVWYSSTTFDASASNTIERQKGEGTFNVDVYGYGRSKGTDNGHDSGDELAALEAQRVLRLIRNVLMASINTQLQLRGLVWQRWPQSATIFQPQSDSRPVDHVVGGRLVLSVVFNEFSPQYEGEPLEYVAIQVIRKETGQVFLAADYDYT